MALLVDTSVWSLLVRRDAPSHVPQVTELERALVVDRVATTGTIVQELLFGVRSLDARSRIVERFMSLDYVTPKLQDHVAAVELRLEFRSAGIQVSAADALIAQLAITYDLTLLTTDRDFDHAAEHVPLRVWRAPQR